MTPHTLDRKTLLGKAGFSLVEMVMMIAISSVLFIGLSRAVHAQLKSAILHRNYLIGLNLTKMQMGTMNNAAYPAIATTAPASDALFPNFVYSQTVSNVLTSGANTLNQILLDVTVGGSVIVRVYTYRTNTVTGTQGFGNGI